MTNCKNCNTEIDQKYCPNCGQPALLKRIDSHYILHEIEHVLHFERGILFTIKGLLTKPGEVVRHFITDNRSRLVKPVIFIIVTSLIYSLTISFFHIQSGGIVTTVVTTDGSGAGFINVVGPEIEKSTIFIFIKWIQNHYGYANIMWGVFIALWAKIFFRKYSYNFYEILILLCFVQGIMMLIFSMFTIFQGASTVNGQKLQGTIGLIYTTWAIAQFFDKSKIMNYFKAFAAYMLGLATFSALFISAGFFIDYLLKK
jgi:hypothetical protein